MMQQTILHNSHENLGARLVEFGGWHMPLHYGSQLEEHHAVRNDAGVFDVSHMAIIDIEGDDCCVFLQKMLANDVGRLHQPGKALYSCMLNEKGGVVDDLIVYYITNSWYRIVVNAATRDKDLAWLRQFSTSYAIHIKERTDLAMIAVQGPNARAKAIDCMPSSLASSVKNLPHFFAAHNDQWFVGRTGYTGEDGFEIMLPATAAVAFWQALIANHVHPCGLGARDTLRLEAGMNLYGADMDEQTSPLISGLAWTVAFEPNQREFIGRNVLEFQRNNRPGKLVGLVMMAKGVLRNHQKVMFLQQACGEITSGGFSPTLSRSIALARVNLEVKDLCQVAVRNKIIDCQVVKPPFVRFGKSCIDDAPNS